MNDGTYLGNMPVDNNYRFGNSHPEYQENPKGNP